MALNEEDILLICGRYEEARTSYERLSSAIHTVLAQVVATLAVRHMITHRAKGQSSLDRKLRKDKDKYSAEDFLKLSPPIKDLAAARVLLYLEADIQPVVAALTAYFQEKDHTFTPSHKQATDGYGYSAWHFHVQCDGSALSVAGIDPATVFEVQVCTLSAHIWNELEHDIIYKQPSGKPDAAQQELLVALHEALGLSSRTANRLMIHTGKLISKNTEPIVDAESLRFSLCSRNEGRQLRGDFQALFELLLGLMDPLTNATLHDCFETGRTEKEARELLKTYDQDGAQDDAGCIVLQLLPRFSLTIIEPFVNSRPNPPSLFRFALRMATTMSKEKLS